MDLVEAGQRVCRVGQGLGDELQQRLGIVGGDLIVGQGRAQFFGVRRLRQASIARDAQALTLDTMQALLEQREVCALAK